MERFRIYLKREFSRRSEVNPRYSLRAFARALDIHHATLSCLMAGTRKLTLPTVQKLGAALGVGPSDLDAFFAPADRPTRPYFALQEDAFCAMSEWSYDAVLELSQIPDFEMSAKAIARALDLSEINAKHILETMERLEMIAPDGNGRWVAKHIDSTNILDPLHTTAAQKKYQAGVLAKSQEALENIPRKKRDHTSVTVAMNPEDLPTVREIIRKFRRELSQFVQRPGAAPREVYQLQVSLFPLSKREENENE